MSDLICQKLKLAMSCKTLKDTTDPMVTYKTLLKTYQDHFVKSMQKGLTTLAKGNTFKIDNHHYVLPGEIYGECCQNLHERIYATS